MESKDKLGGLFHSEIRRELQLKSNRLQLPLLYCPPIQKITRGTQTNENLQTCMRCADEVKMQVCSKLKSRRMVHKTLPSDHSLYKQIPALIFSNTCSKTYASQKKTHSLHIYLQKDVPVQLSSKGGSPQNQPWITMKRATL